MRRVRYSNAKPVLKSAYVLCGKKSNMPRVNHLICEKNCREYKADEYLKCPHYGSWYYEYYEKDVEIPELERKRRKDVN